MTQQQREMLRRRLRPTTAPLAAVRPLTSDPRTEDQDEDSDASADVALLIAV